MKFSKSFKVCKVLMSRFNKRRIPSLHAHVDIETKIMAVTDGRILAIVPITPEEGDKTGLVSSDALSYACRGISKKDVCIGLKLREELEVKNANTGRVFAVYPRPTSPAFPDWKGIIPEQDPTLPRITLDLHQLSLLMEGLGTKKVTLQISGPNRPARVDTVRDDNKAYGVIMPLSPESER